MILAPLAALVAVGIVPLPCQTAHSTPGASEERAAVVLRVEEMQASVENQGPSAVLLAFASHGREALHFRWLPAGARAQSAFPRGARGLEVEVVQRGPAGWTSTGALRFEPSSEGPLETAVLADGSTVATEGGRGLPRASVPSLLPARAFRLLGLPPQHLTTDLPASAPLHVPVPQPTNRPSGDKPPKLEDKPLPPV